MSNLENTPKKACVPPAPPAPKKALVDLGLDMSPLGFDSSTETQIETPGYYDRQFNGAQYGTFYPMYDPFFCYKKYIFHQIFTRKT
ncbi:hypothetical protein B9Z55_028961 [Caenorhabditis nigoni]|uniref:Uncharacterized protein n=1 Tax=Caenorhabditis nigoni TaxID=1611254 RepID=A0A2G5S9Q6_9PELO|nr:hypothetical protein B9Z55_028961 [Caenorhabditis nigoni]